MLCPLFCQHFMITISTITVEKPIHVLCSLLLCLTLRLLRCCFVSFRFCSALLPRHCCFLAMLPSFGKTVVSLACCALTAAASEILAARRILSPFTCSAGLGENQARGNFASHITACSLLFHHIYSHFHYHIPLKNLHQRRKLNLYQHFVVNRNKLVDAFHLQRVF